MSSPAWLDNMIYRTVPLPKTQDLIAWDRLPDWVEWVARDGNGTVWCYEIDTTVRDAVWIAFGGANYRRIDDFPGIVVQIGTVDWTESKQRRPRG